MTARLAWGAALALRAVAAVAAGPIREVTYSATEVIRVPVARGIASHIQLEDGETIAIKPKPGQGSDCEKQPEHLWCINADVGTGHIFVKPRLGATTGNNLAVVTNRRSYSFVFDIVPKASMAAQRVVVRPPQPPALDPTEALAAQRTAQALAMAPRPEEVLEARLNARPLVRNADYSLALGQGSEDIVPKAVFDDGRHTYFEYPGNRPLPTVFEVKPDGSESLVTPRMDPDNDLLVVDRVVRRLMLRAGAAVVSVHNDAFDVEGSAPVAGTAAEGVQRLVRDPGTRQFKEPRP
jgi:type IV secretion system protein VirB9